MNRMISKIALAALFPLCIILTGCGAGPGNFCLCLPASDTPVATPNSGPAKRIYVVQQPAIGSGIILRFAATSSGNATPGNQISPNTAVQQLGTDALGNIYFTTGNIVEYSTETTGTPEQIGEITAGTASRICCIDGMAVSPSGEIVISQDNGEVDEWNAQDSGDVAPTRYILGNSETGGGLSPVVVANQVAVDASDNLYVGAAGAPGVPGVIVFGPAASGNVAPARTIGPDGLAGGVAVDGSGNVYTAGLICSVSACSSAISVYGPGAVAGTAPLRVISGSSAQLGTLGGIAVDSAGTIYVVSTDSAGANPTVLTFSATATGNVAPSSAFTSTAWTTPGFNPSIALY